MSAETTKNTVALFSDKHHQSPSNLAAINIINGHVSVRASSGKQLAYLFVQDEKSQEKLDALHSALEKLCIRDANYWIVLPTGSWVRKNAILGLECHHSEQHRGVILRTQHNRILSFIPCEEMDQQHLIIQELHKAMESKTPRNRRKPSWDFINQAA